MMKNINGLSKEYASVEISSSGAVTFLSIVFSFRNEEDNLRELIRRTEKVLQHEQTQGNITDYEIIFVNDASMDHSLSILLDETKKNKNIRIVNMSRHFGVSPCVMAGFAYSQGDVVIYMDADLQDPPELIPTLLSVWRQTQADVVHTVRKSREGESWGKLLLTRLGYLILYRISSIKLPIEAGDFKLLSRRAVDHLLQLKESNPFIRGLVCWIGFKQESVFYHREARSRGKTKFKVFSSPVINNFLNSALISFSSTPLRFALFLGSIALIVDFIFLIHVLFEKLMGNAIPGWTAIMIAVLFLSGMQFLCTGFMGLYLYYIHEQIRSRPNYIVESTYGFAWDTSNLPASHQHTN